MAAVLVIEPGAQTTVQDLGRPGHARSGVPVGGAADTVSLRVANRLVGNPDAAAALEMALSGGAFRFEHDSLFALAGADGGATVVDGCGALRPAPLCAPHRISAGETLRIGPFLAGARACLAIAGGVRVPLALGSASTHVSAGFGGHEGRPLRAGDRIECGPSPPHAATAPALATALIHDMLHRRSLRALAGVHADAFSQAVLDALWSDEFTVSSESNRMGVRLHGRLPPARADVRRESEGMAPGAVQLPPNAEPIILLADHPTTGGYPVVACVISADLPAAGQLRPGRRIRLQRVTIEEARMAFSELESALDRAVPPRG